MNDTRDLVAHPLDATLVLDSMSESVALHQIVGGADGRAVDYRILECNAAFTRIIGIDRARAVGRLASDLYGGPAPFLDVYARVAETREPARFEAYYPPMDRHFSISAASPRPGYFITVASDETERHRACAALRRYELLAQHGHDILLFIRRDDGRVLDANEAASRAYGYSREELAALTIHDLRATRRDVTAAQMAAADEHGIRFEIDHRRKDGSTFPVEVVSTGATLDGTRVLISVVRDITERRRSEEALLRKQAELQRSEQRNAEERERLAVTLRSIGDAVIATDRDARITLMNDVAEQLTGWRAHEALGRPLREVFHIVDEATGEPADDPVSRVLRDGAVVGLANHTALVARDGAVRPVADSGAPIRDPDGRIGGVVLVFRDQTEARKAEQALRESEERYRDLVHVSPDALFVNRGSRIVFANPACLTLLGATSADQVLGRSPLEFVPPERHAAVRERIAAVLSGGAVPRLEQKIVRLDGTERAVEVSAAPLTQHGEAAVQVILRDVTDRNAADAERERLRDQLAASQRLESLGRLAGGIAHDFNNLLTVILSCSESVRTQLDQGASPRRDDVDDIATAGGRARDLTRQLLAFARKQVINPVVLDVNAIVRGTEKMLRRILGEDVKLAVHLQPDLWPVRCDPGQLEQVILNLAVNARDAMPRGGRLAIETSHVVVPEREGRAGGDHVRLVVRDSGVGMSDEVKSRIFEPFFTTKPRGQGTGLGLATVYGIVAQSDGYVQVESAPNCGATFEIGLPRAAAPLAAAHAPSRDVAPLGTETVCVVEDDALVREVTVRALRSGGYRVVTAKGGREALELLASGSLLIELLVTDVVMPDVDGRSVAEAFRRRHPNLRVLFVSGYEDDVVARHGVLDPGIELLQKPFTPSSLLDRVRTILNDAQQER